MVYSYYYVNLGDRDYFSLFLFLYYYGIKRKNDCFLVFCNCCFNFSFYGLSLIVIGIIINVFGVFFYKLYLKLSEFVIRELG